MHPQLQNILQILATKGHTQYGREAISQLEHALQCAALAENDDRTPDLITACLLHDLGHLLHGLGEDVADRGLDDRIIFPLVMHDCDLGDLPEVVRSLQFVRIHRCADPFMHPEGALREELSTTLRPLCEQIARRLEQITEYSLVSSPPDDEKFRELLLPPARAKVRVPVLGGEP